MVGRQEISIAGRKITRPAIMIGRPKIRQAASFFTSF